MLYPLIFEDGLPNHDKLTEWVGAGRPVPLRAAVTVGLWALVALKVKVALTEAATAGLNVTVNGTLWPAAIVVGIDKPPTVNTELFVLAPVIVTLAPVALSVPEADPLLPTTTLPRDSDAGDTESVPVAAMPVPVSATVNEGFDAFDVIVTLPLAPVADAGVNVTLKVAL